MSLQEELSVQEEVVAGNIKTAAHFEPTVQLESAEHPELQVHTEPSTTQSQPSQTVIPSKVKRSLIRPFQSSPEQRISAPAMPRSITPHPSLVKVRTAITRPFKRPLPRFHKFPELPTEIRLQIWEASVTPRVHELHPCAKLYNDRMTFRSNSSRTPAIFHVCHESRGVALANHQLMSYDPPRDGATGKGILRFYFAPELDTLFLNSLMGLFIMFMLLGFEENYVGVGVMKGWQRVAFDADRTQLISLLSGIAGHAPQPRFKAVFPSLKELVIAFDYTSSGKRRFRTSVWPGENGTSLLELNADAVPRREGFGDDPQDALTPVPLENSTVIDTIFKPMKEYLENDYTDVVPGIKLAKVKRKTFIRGDMRYAFRKTCSAVGIRPRGVFRRL